MIIRHALPSDHPDIIMAMTTWWGDRDLTTSVPRLFLNHFGNTSFVVHDQDRLIGFLIGFFSQSMINQGYIHFAGVHPDYRRSGIGSTLYERFFQKCLEENRTIVQSCTSPVNTTSITFHRSMGFTLLEGQAVEDGIPIWLDYNREGDHKVLFKKELLPVRIQDTFEIRQATVSDTRLLTGIIKKSYQDVAMRFKLTRENCPKHPSNCTDEWIEKDFIRGVSYYLLTRNDTPLGCGGIEQADKDICYLERLCVLPQYRGKGYGGMLVEHIFNRARALNARMLSIGIIARQEELKTWYEKFGFVEEQTKSFAHLPFDVTIMKALVNT